VTLPGSGSLSWTYREFTYAGNRTIREVRTRVLKSTGADTGSTYTLDHPATDVERHVRQLALLVAPDWKSDQVWWFYGAEFGNMAGYLQAFQMRDRTQSYALLRHDAMTWTAQPVSGRMYVSAVESYGNGPTPGSIVRTGKVMQTVSET
jgi:hypothetical protein